jgi:hypothetical protein
MRGLVFDAAIVEPDVPTLPGIRDAAMDVAVRTSTLDAVKVC